MPHSFTPGPWETLKFSQHELQTDFAMVKVGKRVHMIGYSDEDKANAHLIAAAPDLLEALKQMVSIVAIHSRATKNNFAWAEMDEARAAIAKAGGEV